MHEPEQQTIMDRLLTVGKAVPRSEGTGKVTGKTTYTADRMFPRMVWGKMFEETGRKKLPHSVEVNHAIADGFHVGKYFVSLQNKLDAPF